MRVFFFCFLFDAEGLLFFISFGFSLISIFWGRGIFRDFPPEVHLHPKLVVGKMQYRVFSGVIRNEGLRIGLAFGC